MPRRPTEATRLPRLLLLLALLLVGPARADEQALAALFRHYGVQGSLVLSSLSGQQLVHDAPRAAQRFPAASTFKVLNSLIAVQEQVVSGKDAPFTWNGQVYPIASWNADQTLESAFRISCVWCYQQLAQQIGPATYRRYLQQTGYGHLQEPFPLTRFWLDGHLSISALEQVAFLRQVYLRSLPFSAASYDTLSQIMLVEQTPHYRLWAKTGLSGEPPHQLGWYVGYLQNADDVWFFATNLDIDNPEQLPLRQRLTLDALRSVGALD